MVRFGDFFFKYRDFLFPVVFLVLAAGFRPWIPAGEARYDLLMDALGIGLAVAGQGLRAAVIGFAYIKRGGKDKKVYADDLVVEGFFAHARNPLYVGNLLVLFGLIVVHGAPGFVLLGGAFYLFAYRCIVAAEERFLLGKFGAQYEQYCREVNRFLISFRGLGKTLAGMEYDWRRVLRKEYGSTFTWVAAVLALLIYERWANFGLEAERGAIMGIGAMGVPLLVAYVIVRVLKKKRLLGRD